jgi:hypothetical protein
LEKKHETNILARLQHLPIHPSPPNEDLGNISLRIEGELLNKSSYVKIENAWQCNLQSLRPHGSRKLTPSSFAILMKHAPSRTIASEPTTFKKSPKLHTGPVGRASSLIQSIEEMHIQPVKLVPPSQHFSRPTDNDQRPKTPIPSLNSLRDPHLTQVSLDGGIFTHITTSSPNPYTYGTFEPNNPRSQSSSSSNIASSWGTRLLSGLKWIYKNRRVRQTFWILVKLFIIAAVLYSIGVVVLAVCSWLKSLFLDFKDWIGQIAENVRAAIKSWFGAKIGSVANA